MESVETRKLFEIGGKVMSGGIYLIRNNDELIEMREHPYDSEDLLQTLVAP